MLSERRIRVYSYPGSSSPLNVWTNLEIDSDRTDELWIDSNILSPLDLGHSAFDGINKVCFYDFFHAHVSLHPQILTNIKKVSERYDTVWYTGNAKSVPVVRCQRFDFLWNRTKWATLEGRVSWKQLGDARPYARSLMHWNRRRKKYLSLNRSITEYRRKLIDFLLDHDGYLSDLSKGHILINRFTTNDDILQGVCIPPDIKFFNNSYVSCQIESQYHGTESVVFTEKTYDHLIRGRIVLNFGPQGYYQCLANDGWLLPTGVDLSWDQEPDTKKRFQAYIHMLDGLFNLSLDGLHEWFLDNRGMIEHNYNMLEVKPYDTID